MVEIKTKIMKYKITCYERGVEALASSTEFSSLEEASTYIQDRWQGVEYKDSSDGFHTDYSSYILEGFTFQDIGRMDFSDEWPEFIFTKFI